MGEVKLTRSQRILLAELGSEPNMTAECAAELEWRSAKVLAEKGLIEVIGGAPERQAAGYWFDAKITAAGLSTLQVQELQGSSTETESGNDQDSSRDHDPSTCAARAEDGLAGPRSGGTE